MPISRDPRNDRRRRVLRDSMDQAASVEPRQRRAAADGELEPRRGAGYSQDVRRACGTRLVQLIPIRQTTYWAAVIASTVIPITLLVFHYLIYVSGSLEWFGHPLAVSLDASHPRSIATWFCSHVWLLCLGATILTFQLRKHKLDDYDGEYRLWFWMILTCLFASVDATTRVSELFGLALNPWSQLNLGWSGPAVVKATMAVLIGLLGLRLCSELKTVPLSLSFWLLGMLAWAGSAALAQEEFRLDISLQLRIWLKVSLWLGGLTAIWLAALTYLRHVYIEAQQRFLARSRMRSRNAVPIGQRIRESMPRFRRDEVDEEDDLPRRRWIPSFNRARGGEDIEEQEEGGETARERRRREKQELAELRRLEREEQRQQKLEARRLAKQESANQSDDDDVDQDARPRRRLGWNKFFNRRSQNADLGDQEMEEAEAEYDERAVRGRRAATRSEESDEEETPRRSGLFGRFLRSPKDSDDAEEYQKVSAESSRSSRRKARVETDEDYDEDTEQESTSRRRWFSLRRNRGDSQIDGEDQPVKEQPPKERVKKSGGFFSRFRLQPPEDDMDDAADTGAEHRARPVDQSRLPSTSRDDDDDPFDDAEPDRPLTRAERKRLRRQQKQRAA